MHYQRSFLPMKGSDRYPTTRIPEIISASRKVGFHPIDPLFVLAKIHPVDRSVGSGCSFCSMNPSTSSYPRSLGFFPADVDGIDRLAELALDMRWSWNHATDTIWRQLDPILWELTQNPWIVLQTVSRERLEQALSNVDFRHTVDELLRDNRAKSDCQAWFQLQHPSSPLKCVAYFSMEFMLSEALPIYSGGLGNVAGDQLKAASDLGVPVVGVGLLFQQGYFRQVIDQDGAQQALYPYNDPGQLPITPLREPNGEWLRLEVTLPGYSVWLRAWEVQVGRVKLYLLDSNDAANFPAHRGITSELYGGGPELRLKQELVLGIGGWRLLAALGISPDVCHLNEGHAAFAVLERARSFMHASGLPFSAAMAATRAGNLFTTHTAVAAGFDRFPPSLLERYLGGYARDALGIPFQHLLSMGRENSEDVAEWFNMAFLAARGSGSVNGVSRLHGAQSRNLFSPLFPRRPLAEVPVGHVTNGVHHPTWDSAAADELWTRACGKDRWLGLAGKSDPESIRTVPDEALWEFRNVSRGTLVAYARERVARHEAAAGASAARIEEVRHLFRPDVLTLGFARRFATYKRPNLLLQDPARLLRLLSNPQRPVQLMLAGKAHPADFAGQALIKEWVQFVRRPDVRPHATFLSDYDMHLTEHLVQGVDVWINTPRRPWEACGTSGMKILVNGGIHLSELDGWWAEAYAPDLGWALRDGVAADDHSFGDASDAVALYERLEQQVIPEFYDRDEKGIPRAWVRRMRESMAQLTPVFSAERAVREYTAEYYLPAADAYHARIANQGAVGQDIAEWHRLLERTWPQLHFGKLKVESRADRLYFEIPVYLHGLGPAAVRVELFANGIGSGLPVRQEMNLLPFPPDETGCHLYGTEVPADRPANDYTPRVLPAFDGVNIALEAPRILWLR